MFKVHMDYETFKEKPNSYKIAELGNRITGHTFLMTPQEFAVSVGEQGRTFLPAIMDGKRKQENFQEQQLFALDFDGTITEEEFWDRSNKVGICPFLIYKTFRYSETEKRMRVVYKNDCVINNVESAQIIIRLLLYLFPEADCQCKDLARLFLGGKGIMFFCEENEINPVALAIAVQTYMKISDSHNVTRKMNQIAKNISVDIKDGVLRILSCCGVFKSEEIRIHPYIFLMGCNQKSSLFYYYEKYNQVERKLEEKKNILKTVQRKSMRDLQNTCPLFNEFLRSDIHHDLKFMLATNLRFVKGGKNMFFEALTSNVEKWKEAWKYIGANNYAPMRCEAGQCQYCSKCKCHSLYEKLTQKIIVKNEPDYISLKEGENRLNEYVNKAVDLGVRKDIVLIKAQTAIGKTTTYCNLVANRDTNDKPIMIAVPTNKLQQEVYEALKIKGVEVTKTENIGEVIKSCGLYDLYDDIKVLYKKGLGKKVKGTIKKYLDNHDIHYMKRLRIEDSLKGSEKLDGTMHVVTTQAMLINLKEPILEQYEIIVDEDVLMTLFKTTDEVSFYELQQLIESPWIMHHNRARLRELLQMQHETICYTGLRPIDEDLLEEMLEHINCCSSLPDFLSSSTCYIDQKSKTITYFEGKQLPKIPMTIVSATINKKLYADYFKNRYIQYAEVPLVQYAGKLIQYTAYSMSRHFIDSSGYKSIKDCVDMITGNDEMNVITFRKYNELASMYFGKTEGYNEFKGKNICVIGTPHNIPFIYKLIGKHMGYSIEERMNRHTVETESFQFGMMTFGNEDMQNLQLYFIESELEQAVGRARLLRFDCTVYLFSNYPLKQAEIHQEEFLENAECHRQM